MQSLVILKLMMQTNTVEVKMITFYLFFEGYEVRQGSREELWQTGVILEDLLTGVGDAFMSGRETCKNEHLKRDEK